MDRKPRPPRNVRPLRKIDKPADDAHRRRLEELKRQVEEGTYDADPETIAREIMKKGLDAD